MLRSRDGDEDEEEEVDQGDIDGDLGDHPTVSPFSPPGSPVCSPVSSPKSPMVLGGSSSKGPTRVSVTDERCQSVEQIGCSESGRFSGRTDGLSGRSGSRSQSLSPRKGETRYQLGQRVVTLSGYQGTVRFVGRTLFCAGLWVGVELDEPRGHSNGSFGGEECFQCTENHGVFVRPHMLRPAG